MRLEQERAHPTTTVPASRPRHQILSCGTPPSFPALSTLASRRSSSSCITIVFALAFCSSSSVHLQRATNWRRRLAAGILRIPNPVGFGKLLLHAIYAENLPSMDHGLVNTAGRKWLDDCLNSTGVKGPFRPPSPA
jgi:hypothetical protein